MRISINRRSFQICTTSYSSYLVSFTIVDYVIRGYYGNTRRLCKMFAYAARIYMLNLHERVEYLCSVRTKANIPKHVYPIARYDNNVSNTTDKVKCRACENGIYDASYALSLSTRCLKCCSWKEQHMFTCTCKLVYIYIYMYL